MLDWVWSKLSQVTVSIGSLKIQDMIKILKQSGHYFSVNVYVVDTVLRYYGMFQYRVMWFWEKVSFRISLRNFV